MIKFSRVITLVVMVSLLMIMSVAQAQDKKILYTSQEMGPDDIPTLDPSQASDVPSVQIISQIFPELMRVNEVTSAVEDGVATYTVSEDGLVYTFTLGDFPWVRYNPETDTVEEVKDDAGNTRMLTAADFANTFIRTMDPKVASDYSYVLVPWIAGADAWANSSPDATEEERAAIIETVGVKALDDKTLEVTATSTSSVFLNVVGMWITTGAPKWLIDELGDVWIEPENIATYGPWAVKDWVHGESLTLIKNPLWAGTASIPAPKIDEVVFRFLGEDVQTTAFEAGELDVSEVDAAQFDRIVADPTLSAQLHVGPGTCTYYYGFNVRREPFNDPRAVMAFSMAIDRALITEEVTGRGELPAGFFTLPSLFAAPKQEDYPDYAISSDAEGAKALWEEYLAETGKTNADFALTILHNNSSLHASIAQAIQQMWKDTLGIEVAISTLDFATYLDVRQDADIFRAAWCFDYPDASNYLFDVFHSSVSPDNGFSNAEYDELVTQASAETDGAARTALYAEAERLLVRDAASIAPIYYYVGLSLTRDGIERTHSVIGREYYEKWDISN